MPIDQLVELPIAIASIVPLGTADIILVELLVGTSSPFSLTTMPTVKSLRMTLGYHCVVSMVSSHARHPRARLAGAERTWRRKLSSVIPEQPKGLNPAERWAVPVNRINVEHCIALEPAYP